MLKNQNRLFSDSCWVYVQKDSNDDYVIAITYDEDFYQNESSAGRSLLLWRKFDDTLSAAGYRMILKGLSPESLQEVLKKHNKK